MSRRPEGVGTDIGPAPSPVFTHLLASHRATDWICRFWQIQWTPRPRPSYRDEVAVLPQHDMELTPRPSNRRTTDLASELPSHLPCHLPSHLPSYLPSLPLIDLTHLLTDLRNDLLADLLIDEETDVLAVPPFTPTPPSGKPSRSIRYQTEAMQ